MRPSKSKGGHINITLNKQVRVLWSAWEPGLSGNWTSSSGGGVWIADLFHKLEKYDIVPLYIGKYQSADALPLADALMVQWRWSFADIAAAASNNKSYQERQRAYEMQIAAMEKYSKAGLPILVHDQDFQMTEEDVQFCRKLGAKLYSPCTNPKTNFKSLHYSYPFPSKGNPHTPRTHQLVYIGNNYRRYDQFKKYYGQGQPGIRPHVYGNWLEPSPLRESPEQVQEENPNVLFKGRCSQLDVVKLLKEAFATVHIAPQDYCNHGLLGLRWSEATAAGTIGLICEEFVHIIGLEELYVKPSDLFIKLREISTSHEYRSRLFDLQADFVLATMRHYDWVSVLRNANK